MKKSFKFKLITMVILVIIISNFIATNFVYGDDADNTIKVEEYMNELYDDKFSETGKGDAENAIGGLTEDQFSRTNKSDNI